MRVSDLMTRSVLSVSEDANIFDAIRLMLRNHVSGLPVVNSDNQVVGIVTEGDLLNRLETGTQKQRSGLALFFAGPGKMAADYVHAAGRKVGDVMTRGVQTVDIDAPLAEAVEKMERHRCKRLPVMSESRMVGILSRVDFLRAIVSNETAQLPATDAAIREKLLAVLAAQRWAMPSLLDISVRDGVVELNGVITDERVRGALVVAAENISGVKGVHDRLAWVEPASGMVIETSGVSEETVSDSRKP
jgi:CBS-domain-containing membrane protein